MKIMLTHTGTQFVWLGYRSKKQHRVRYCRIFVPLIRISASIVACKCSQFFNVTLFRRNACYAQDEGCAEQNIGALDRLYFKCTEYWWLIRVAVIAEMLKVIAMADEHLFFMISEVFHSFHRQRCEKIDTIQRYPVLMLHLHILGYNKPKRYMNLTIPTPTPTFKLLNPFPPMPLLFLQLLFYILHCHSIDVRLSKMCLLRWWKAKESIYPVSDSGRKKPNSLTT